MKNAIGQGFFSFYFSFLIPIIPDFFFLCVCVQNSIVGGHTRVDIVCLLQQKMHITKSGSSLVSSSHLLDATWENALSHFRRALIECGSSLNVEHSQRLGLLFSKRVGNTEELKKWASIFDAEDVPTTALLLKALVSHNQWRTAMQLLEINRDATTTKELSEVLAQNLTRIGLWQETLSLATLLAPNADSRTTQTALQNTSKVTSLSSEQEKSDSFQMATNPSFLPEEEQSKYCGFASAVAQGFPRRQDWKSAVEVLRQLQSVADSKTQIHLFEYEVARLVHDGQQYQEVIEQSRSDVRFRSSPSLLRSLLHCALIIEDGPLSVQCLELLCSFGPCAISVCSFEAACKLFISCSTGYARDDLARFESLVCSNANFVRRRETQKSVAAFCADYDLRIPPFVNGNLHSATSKEQTRGVAIKKSVTQLDRVATALLRQGRWKEALQVANDIQGQSAQDETERIIIETLVDSSGSWEKTLQFFSA